MKFTASEIATTIFEDVNLKLSSPKWSEDKIIEQSALLFTEVQGSRKFSSMKEVSRMYYNLCMRYPKIYYPIYENRVGTTLSECLIFVHYELSK